MTDQQQTQDRLFMQYLLTQAGDARLSKLEARLDALEKAHPATADTTSHDSLSTLVLYTILAILLLWLMNMPIPGIYPDSPPRLDFLTMLRGFLRPVALWLLDDHDE
jgi:hypothetical protein